MNFEGFIIVREDHDSSYTVTHWEDTSEFAEFMKEIDETVYDYNSAFSIASKGSNSMSRIDNMRELNAIAKRVPPKVAKMIWGCIPSHF